MTGTAIAALASTFWGLKVGLPALNFTRNYWEATPQHIRDDPVAKLYGFGDGRWEQLARSLGEGDRYAVVVQGEGEHEIRNYAAYRLLPAIQVRAASEANVVVHYEVGESRSDCTQIGRDICIVRRGP